MATRPGLVVSIVIALRIITIPSRVFILRIGLCASREDNLGFVSRPVLVPPGFTAFVFVFVFALALALDFATGQPEER